VFSQSNCIELKECLACGSNDLKPTLDLGFQPLANSFLSDRSEWLEMFPLAINRCEKCYHVQLTHAVNPDKMYKDYLYVSGTSQTMNDHFEWFANYSKEYYESMSKQHLSSVLDIGCNDGSQLKYFISDTVKTYGVDPAENLAATSRADGHNIYVGYFDEEYVDIEGGQYDIVIAQNVFAHNYDPITFLQNAKKIMHNKSLFFVQTSQADMILNNEFDTIYHEHISFYNINSMNELCKRAGLYLIDVTKCPLHGNSYIFVISKEDKRPYNVQNLIDMERKAGLLTDATYEKYTNRCNQVAEEFRLAVGRAKKAGYRIIGYGAAAKGMTLLNYATQTFN
jgi:SAM-dependent methyltransferase